MKGVIRNILYLTTVAVLTFIGTGCNRRTASEHTENKPVIAVSFPQQAYLLSYLTGDEYDIITLLPPGTDPEIYEPTMSTLKTLTRASLYFTMDSPGFEQAIVRSVHDNFPGLRVIDSSEGIERLAHIHSGGEGHGAEGCAVSSHSHEYVEAADRDINTECHEHGHEHSKGHGHTAADPHILTSVVNARIMAATMARNLISHNPENEQKYLSRLAGLDSLLKAYNDSLRRMFSSGSRPFVILHPSLSYFSRDYGLKQISMEQSGKEPTPRQYAETMKHIHGVRPAILVSERQHSSLRLQEAAKELDIKTIDVDLNTEDWISELFRIASYLSLPNARESQSKIKNTSSENPNKTGEM